MRWRATTCVKRREELLITHPAFVLQEAVPAAPLCRHVAVDMDRRTRQFALTVNRAARTLAA